MKGSRGVSIDSRSTSSSCLSLRVLWELCHPPKAVAAQHVATRRAVDLIYFLLLAFTQRGVYKAEEREVRYTCRVEEASEEADICIPTRSSHCWQDGTVSLKSVQFIFSRFFDTHGSWCVCAQMCVLRTLCKMNSWVHLLAFPTWVLFISLCLHNNVFVSPFFRCVHNMTAHYQEEKRHVTEEKRYEAQHTPTKTKQNTLRTKNKDATCLFVHVSV